MLKRTPKRITHHGDAHNGENFPRFSSSRMVIEGNSSTEEQVDEIFLRLENDLPGKMKDENKKSENYILKASSSL